MKSMPSSGSRLSVRIASALSAGGPQMPGPVIRIAPKPRRQTSMSPPILKKPDLRASSFAISILLVVQGNVQEGDLLPRALLLLDSMSQARAARFALHCGCRRHQTEPALESFEECCRH